MSRTPTALATLLAAALGLAAPSALAQDGRPESAGEATGSVAPSTGGAIDQPTPDQLRRLRERREDERTQADLPPPEAISPEIDILAPAPDAFQEP